MIGEEDHIRIQVILAGLQLEKAYNIADELDRVLHDALHFAFDSQLGYLTECPTNLGTGLRASVMMHLPLLEGTGKLRNLCENIGKIGFTVRGIYGEGSKSRASLYQISNQVTLGISEQNAIQNLSLIANQLMENAEFSQLNAIVQQDIQEEIMMTIKWKLNGKQDTVNRVRRMMEIIDSYNKDKAIEDKKNLAELTDYIQNYSDMTFNEYKQMKANKQ
jgi:protein arginine kinase